MPLSVTALHQTEYARQGKLIFTAVTTSSPLGVSSRKTKLVHPFSTRYKGANLQKISLLEQPTHTGDMSDA